MTNKPRRARQEAGKSAHRETSAHTSCHSTAPLAYFITFTTYGTWLHGEKRGSVDPGHNTPGTPVVEPDPHRHALDQRGLKHTCITLDAARRAVVRSALTDVARHRGWTVHALNVRTNHVHLVVSAPDPPERVMNAVKSWATRKMVESGVLCPDVKAWTRHGSTRYLWKESSVLEASRYVCEGQGDDLDDPRDQPAS